MNMKCPQCGSEYCGPLRCRFTMKKHTTVGEEPFNCQMEGTPCDRWCGAIPCELSDTTAVEQPFDFFKELDRVAKILYPKG